MAPRDPVLGEQIDATATLIAHYAVQIADYERSIRVLKAHIALWDADRLRLMEAERDGTQA